MKKIIDNNNSAVLYTCPLPCAATLPVCLPVVGEPGPSGTPGAPPGAWSLVFQQEYGTHQQRRDDRGGRNS